MSERPRTELSERQRLTAVVLGAVLGIVLVLLTVAGMGVVEIGLVLLPLVAAPALGFYLWARRRDLG